MKTELILALDVPEADRALELIGKLKGLPITYKVGSELFLASGPELVKRLAGQGEKIFLDLKFHDIPNTVAKAAKQASNMGVQMFTAHLAGGKTMFQAIAKEFAMSMGDSHSKALPMVLGVSVLTSFDETGWKEVVHGAAKNTFPIKETVSNWVSLARDWGVGGVVCSAHELSSIRGKFPELFLVVPGIRPKGIAAQDQARVMTPAEAHAEGANAIVVGRPVLDSTDPRKTVEEILNDLRNP